MSKSTKNAQAASFTSGQLTNLLVVSLLLIAAAFLYINSGQHYEEFITSQQKLMDKSASDTVQTLTVYIDQTRRIVNLFADSETELILQLADDPADEELGETFRKRIKQKIPDYFSFTITDVTGIPLLDDFNGELGEVCLRDIIKFTKTEHNAELFIHPNPLQYHFDIMSPIKLDDGEGVFFVSFKPDVLSKLLASSEIGTHQMMLLHQNNPTLIEITSLGSRDKLQREYNLTSVELESISVKHNVPGSYWSLIYLPDIHLYSKVQRHYRMQAAQVFLIILVFSVIMLLLIKREEKRRHEAERALMDSHRSLETRVEDRTKELREEIGVRTETEVKLTESEHRYELAAKGAHDGIWEWNPCEDKLYFSSRWLELFSNEQFGSEHSLGDWLALVYNDDRRIVSMAFEQARKGKAEIIDIEFRMRDKNDLTRWYRCHAATEKNSEGVVIRVAGSQADIHEHKLAAEQLQHDAFHDMLTGLPNRHVFMDRLEQAVNKQRRDKNYLYAVMFMDLDRFKNINDSLGHNAGDTLLKGVAKRMSICLRPGDSLARLGGDEFVILVNDFKNLSDVTTLAERINNVVAQPFTIDGQELIINTSIGIALGSEDYTDPELVLRDSDIAMYRAKNTGAGKYFIYNESIRHDTMARLKTETDLRKAIENEQLLIYYQPIIDISQGSIYGLESLLRWKHPEKGVVLPDDFIPLAEETGLIVPMGSWIMSGSCFQLKQWQNKYPGYDSLSMSVNLSCKQFLQTNLVENIRQILKDAQIDKSDILLNLEITETVVMQNASCSTDILQDLKSLGIRLAVDDFGTGYSSLAYLQRFPIDILKIDKQFISMIDKDEESRAIVKTVIELASNLNLKVVAEGIEKVEQLHILRELGCHYGQGYYFSKPVPAVEIETLLASHPGWLD